MTQAQPKAIYLKDYAPPDFLIDNVFLYFDLHDTFTQVKAVLEMRRNPQSKQQHAPLVLNGEEMQLKSVALDGIPLRSDQYQVDAEHLTIAKVPNKFILETEVEIKPQENTQLSGLYQSQGNFCTQCEAHGFRRIIYFLDRPDVMSHFTTCIAADRIRYPVMLSNGNLVDHKELSGNRHWVKWVDPSLKPCYLFALVAGDFEWLEDKFITKSGRSVLLRVYVEKGKLNQANFALGALQRAMRWDETTYGREYDLDIYMIVAVSDFNMGAMENKGLNLFNDRFILADSKTATDDDFKNIESVIGHEYFHNWTGNRITCRNWFQITLKEGLTIFRDQSFTGDLHSRVVERIDEANVIRTAQFAQDAGPLAHPIRPDSYIEVNNFYTVTVYNKGAEVIRMIQTIIGKEKFREGMDLYFKRHDGQAVTTEEFVKVFEEVSGEDLSQFRLWYAQAGTPVLDVTGSYDAKQQLYTLTVKQSCPSTPGQPEKKNFHVPLAVGLLDKKTGKDLLSPSIKILNVKQQVDQFKFSNIRQEPVPSLLRNFSAPVKLNYKYADEDLFFLLMHDSDGFNRWDAGQKLAIKLIFQLIKDYQQQRPLQLDHGLVNSFKTLIADKNLEQSLLTQMLSLPRAAYIIELMQVADVEAIHHVRKFILKELARRLPDEFLQTYQSNNTSEPYVFNGKAVGRRSLKNLCLNYLAHLDNPEVHKLSMQQFHAADNMTDEMGALTALMDFDCRERTEALAEFYEKWKTEDLVVDKWFALQALSSLPDTLKKVKELMRHPAFSLKNPNKVRALIGTFCQGNYINFHHKSGEGYVFIADQVLALDKLNPQVAARILEPLTRWRKFDEKRQQLMRAQLERIAKTPRLSKDVYEIATKSL